MNSGEIAEVNLRKLIFFLLSIIEVCKLTFHKIELDMRNLVKRLKSKAMLRIVMFATLFVLLDTFIEMKKKTEEQVTYSITLENLAQGQNGETGGGGADGETGGAGGGTDGETGGSNNNEPIREGIYIHYWHPKSTVVSILSKLKPREAASTRTTSTSGSISINQENVSIGGSTSSSYTYEIRTTYYECKFSPLSPKCLQKEEYTLFNYNLVQN